MHIKKSYFYHNTHFIPIRGASRNLSKPSLMSNGDSNDYFYADTKKKSQKRRSL